MREIQTGHTHLMLVSVLDHVLPDQTPVCLKDACLYGAEGEWTSVQVACRTDVPVALMIHGPDQVRVRQVTRVPCQRLCNEQRDDDYVFTEPGLYPDRLVPAELSFSPSENWQSLWLDVKIRSVESERLLQLVPLSMPDQALTVNLRCLPALPELRLYHTEWFHTDCLADYYQVPVFSEEHWAIIENFVQSAVEHGINMLYTPLFTPPLDTKEGGERTTVQLVGVSRQNGVYRFDFSLLDRWIDMAMRCGIREIECSHLFTQWGARCAPKIMADTGSGVPERIFGWDTPGTGSEYLAFLHAFLPELVSFLKKKGVLEHTWFHISDEPGPEDREQYGKAAKAVQPYVREAHMLDALSHVEFYETGLVQTPVCAINRLEPFLKRQVQPLFGYYCTAQCVDVPNRFIGMPGRRNRILGVLLYKTGLQGFLQWGFNFYNSQYSLEHLDPHLSTDAGGAFPCGDPFLVYPEPNGQVAESVRGNLLKAAWQDYRLLCLLEERNGRESVLQFLDGLFPNLSFTNYPRENAFFEKLWEHAWHALQNLNLEKSRSR